MYPDPSTAQKFIAESQKASTKRLRLIKREKRDVGINTPGFLERMAFVTTLSGVHVSESSALQISTVYQCVRYISDAIAQMPLRLYREVKQGKEKATNHPIDRLLHRSPNPLMSAFVFKKTLQAHLLLWGNAFAEIVRNGAGAVVEIWPLLPNRIRIQMFNSQPFYYYIADNGREVRLSEVLHLRSLSSDGIVGYSPIAVQREKLGLAKASETYRARFFANDSRPAGVLKHSGTLSGDAQKRLEKRWEESHGGLNAHRVAVLEEGLSWEAVGVPPDEAQFIQGEEFTKADIAAIYGVPPYKIGLLKPGTVSFASVEQQAIDSVVDCVAPWVVCWESGLDLALLTPTEQQNYFTKFSMQGLLRGDSQSRAEFYQKLFDRGVFSINDILELEDRNTIGSAGDRRFIPLNMVPLDKIDEMLDQKQKPATTAPKSSAMNGDMPRLLNGHGE